jgi:uncharacterized membrane protein YhaH (DUF805 family)
MGWRYGRSNRATYWAGIGIVIVLFVGMNLHASKTVPVPEFILIVLSVPRLHDIGKSAWWAGAVFLFEIAVALLAFMTLPLVTRLLLPACL